MSVDLYNPRRMMQALIQRKPPRSFLRQMCSRRDEFSDAELIDVDVKTGQRRLAPFVNPKAPGKVVDRIGFQTRIYTPPLVAPKRPLTVSDLQKRLPGETIYSTQTADERAAILLGEDLGELDDMIARREEWMIARAVFDSAIEISADDFDGTISFPRDATVTVGTLGTDDQWNKSTANIVGNIRDWRRRVIKLTGIAPDFMICGEEAADALVNAPSLKGLTGALNTLRMDLGQIKPELREGGATYYGMFAGTGIDVWGYDEWYVDPADGEEKPMVPPKKILLGSSQAYAAMRYGAVGVTSGLDGNAQLALVAGRRVPESWIEKEPAVRFLKVSARPLFVPVQNDAFLTAQVVAD